MFEDTSLPHGAMLSLLCIGVRPCREVRVAHCLDFKT